jgi:hypothetical protein
MINYFILAIFVVVAIELFVRIDALVFVHKMYEKLSNFAKLMSSKNISDHWKERVIPSYALIIIINALKFLGVLLLIMALFIGLALLFDGFFQFSISVVGIVEMLIFSPLYLKIRQKLRVVIDE